MMSVRGAILVGVTAGVMALGGCSAMFSGTGIDGDLDYAEADGTSARTCNGNVGSYNLPKKLLTVTITRGARGFGISVVSSGDTVKYVADTRHLFCLNFLASPLARDRIGIERTAGNLLQRIYSKAEDRSKQVGQNLITAAGDLAAAVAAGGVRNLELRAAEAQIKDSQGNPVLAEFSFDPFDYQQTEAINRELVYFGYCIYFETRNDPFVPPWSPTLCRKSSGVAVEDAASMPQGIGNLPINPDAMNLGILYRPELTHTMKILRRYDPEDRSEAWKLVGSEYVKMPNNAPVLMLGVTRSLFVTNEVFFDFKNGLLYDVSIKKPSPLEAVVGLPLYAVQVVLSVPAATLRIFNNDAANRRALIATNAELIETLRKFRGDAEARALALEGTALILSGSGLDGRSAVILPGRSGSASVTSGGETSPALRSLGACLDDENVTQSEGGRQNCLDILSQGE